MQRYAEREKREFSSRKKKGDEEKNRIFLESGRVEEELKRFCWETVFPE
jgi:hypothetical protein